MPGNLVTNNSKPYLRIVGGNFAQTVDKNTPKARLREWETKDGTKGSKWELTYMNWSGHIQAIRFKDGEFGTDCIIDLGDAFICLNTSTRYFTDFASKIWGADLSKEVLLHPYDIEDGQKRKTGISVQIDGEKLKNAFYDWESKQFLHGFPAIDEEKKVKKNYWKLYFAEVEAFLMEKLENMHIPRSAQVAEAMGGEVVDDGAPLPTEEVAPTVADDLPF